MSDEVASVDVATERWEALAQQLILATRLGPEATERALRTFIDYRESLGDPKPLHSDPVRLDDYRNRLQRVTMVLFAVITDHLVTEVELRVGDHPDLVVHRNRGRIDTIEPSSALVERLTKFQDPWIRFRLMFDPLVRVQRQLLEELQHGGERELRSHPTMGLILDELTVHNTLRLRPQDELGRNDVAHRLIENLITSAAFDRHMASVMPRVLANYLQEPTQADVRSHYVSNDLSPSFLYMTNVIYLALEELLPDCVPACYDEDPFVIARESPHIDFVENVN